MRRRKIISKCSGRVYVLIIFFCSNLLYFSAQRKLQLMASFQQRKPSFDNYNYLRASVRRDDVFESELISLQQQLSTLSSQPPNLLYLNATEKSKFPSEVIGDDTRFLNSTSRTNLHSAPSKKSSSPSHEPSASPSVEDIVIIERTTKSQDTVQSSPVKLSSEVASTILPKKMILVTGLESSGTKLVTEAIAVASGAYTGSLTSIRPHGNSFHGRTSNAVIEVLHQSLPWGSTCESEVDAASLKTLPVLVPKQCGYSKTNGFLWDNHIGGSNNPYCNKLGLETLVEYPNRFFIDIASHIKWYRERGVVASAVIVVRDSSIETISKYHDHCRRNDLANLENNHAMKIIKEAVKKLSTETGPDGTTELLIVSYEAIMAIGDTYFLDFVFPNLGIRSSRVTASFIDGNRKYVHTP